MASFVAVSEFSLENQFREFLPSLYREETMGSFHGEVVPIHSMDTPLLIHFSSDVSTKYLQDGKTQYMRFTYRVKSVSSNNITLYLNPL